MIDLFPLSTVFTDIMMWIYSPTMFILIQGQDNIIDYGNKAVFILIGAKLLDSLTWLVVFFLDILPYTYGLVSQIGRNVCTN